MRITELEGFEQCPTVLVTVTCAMFSIFATKKKPSTITCVILPSSLLV